MTRGLYLRRVGIAVLLITMMIAAVVQFMGAGFVQRSETPQVTTVRKSGSDFEFTATHTEEVTFHWDRIFVLSACGAVGVLLMFAGQLRRERRT